MGLVLLFLSGLLISAETATVTVSDTIARFGESHTVTCSVDSPATSLTYQWLQGVLPIQTTSSPTYEFSSVGVSDAGDNYACVVLDGQNELGRRSWALNVTIPGFTWQIRRSPGGEHYVSQRMNISCVGFLGSTEGLKANSSILDPQGDPIPAGVEGDRVRLFDLQKTSAGYETRLEFRALSAEDAGTYKCTGTVMAAVPNQYITNGVEELDFAIVITPIMIDMEIVASTPLPRLLDSAPYNQLSLSCAAMMRVRVSPVPFNVTFSWWQSMVGGPLQAVPPEEFTNASYGSTVTSQLSVNVSAAGTHTYRCRVALDLRPAPDNKSKEIERNITVYGPSPPGRPVNLTALVILHNRATVRWSVPILTYDPETYVVHYGTSMSALDQSSSAVMTTSMELTGLQVDTQYYFTVQANNSNGTRTSDEQRFTTTASPPSPPRSLTHRRDATRLTTYHFTWVLDEDPGGVVTKQKVTCTPSEGTSLSMEVGRAATAATLSGFEYLERYVCDVQAAAGSVYSLNSNNISITVTEEVPDMVSCGTVKVPMGRFSDVYSKLNDDAVTVVVEWKPPAEVRGVLTTYTLKFTSYISVAVIRAVTVNASTTSYNFTNLSLNDGEPYNVSVEASNSLATKSPPCFITDFIKQLTPPPVVDLKVVRSSPSEINVTWAVPSLVDAKGFVDYVLEYTPATPTEGRRRRRQTSTSRCTASPCTVPVEMGGAMLVSLDPTQTYTVSVSPMNEDGVMGTLKSATVKPTGTDPFPLLFVIVGVVVGTLVLAVLLLCIIVICCCCKRRRSTKLGLMSVDVEEHMELDKKMADVEVSPEENPIYSQPQLTLVDRLRPVPVDKFSDYVMGMHDRRDKLFDQEYESLDKESTSTSACDIAKMNKSKNRFNNIYPYDFSRVKIESIDGVEGSDYINASYIDGYGRPNAYIAAQGPMPGTVGDFWRMIYEHRITTIVMLTKFNEGGKRKCEQYWPEKVREEQLQKDTGIKVTYKELTPFADYEIRKFEVRNHSDEESCEIPLIVTHYQFLGWPDHGVPKFATSLIQFIRRIKSEYQRQLDSSAPMVVHCSAGVGRTGTFITLDAMLEKMKAEQAIGVYEFVRNMRSKRVFMVQTTNQYVFIHDALEELITCADTSVEAPGLRDKINELNAVNPATTNTGFEDQFELLRNVSRIPSMAERSEALQHYNERKNRYQERGPYNNNRMRLRPTTDMGSDYINASFVDGYKHRNAYIATQAPLEETVHDLWRMIWEFGGRVIVLLGPLQEGNQTLCRFWPEEEKVVEIHGKLAVTLESERVVKGYIERKIHIREEKADGTPGQGFVVTLYHYENWPEYDRPLTSAGILHLITSLGHCQRTTGNKHITVMCSDGVGRTGAFLAIHAMVERVNTENVVDFFQFIKSSRIHRADLVMELEHYRFCHDTLAEYLETNKSYANFRDISTSTPGQADVAPPLASTSHPDS